MTRIPIDDDQQPEDQSAQELEGEPAPEANGTDVERLKAERDMLFEKLARAQADFQNSRKRLQAESDQRAAYANAALIKSLLPVIDNFERALAVEPEKTDSKSTLLLIKRKDFGIRFWMLANSGQRQASSRAAWQPETRFGLKLQWPYTVMKLVKTLLSWKQISDGSAS